MPTGFIKHQTADGSDTLYSASLGEAYHSLNGAITESRHVFIEAGLLARGKKTLSVFELGFGTGLNALLSWQAAVEKGLVVTYESIEAFPLEAESYSTLQFPQAAPQLPADALTRLHQAPWGKPTPLDPSFTLLKREGDILQHTLDTHYDLVFFDAFAPTIQPELWEETLMKRLFEAMSEGSLLVTYCAKGEVRRRLQRAGFRVERLPGPPGKREMLRANR